MSRPFVYVNMAMTVDGKITSATREYPRFTSPRDRETMDRLRAEADAILVGAGTMRADNPKLYVRSTAMRDYRQALGKPAGLDKVVVSAKLDLPDDCRFFDDRHGGAKILATIEEAPRERRERLRDAAEIWSCGSRRVDLRLLLERLAERGVERLLVEGGGETNWQLFQADLVDELHVTIAPALLGGRDAPTLLEGIGWTMENQRRLDLRGLERDGDELYLRYAVERG